MGSSELARNRTYVVLHIRQNVIEHIQKCHKPRSEIFCSHNNELKPSPFSFLPAFCSTVVRRCDGNFVQSQCSAAVTKIQNRINKEKVGRKSYYCPSFWSRDQKLGHYTSRICHPNLFDFCVFINFLKGH